MANKKINSNGHEFVDLGLPSGTLWATCNVGAKRPSDFGLYFQWGDTQGYTKEQIGKEKQFNVDDYKWNPNGDGKTFTKYPNTGASLELEDDAASANMGGDWHIPSPTQYQELIDNTIKEWATFDDVNGILFTSKKDDSKFIFIPEAGYAWDGSVHGSGNYGNVWSSMLSTFDANLGQDLDFDLVSTGLYDDGRCSGLSVRGVIDKKSNNSKDKKSNMEDKLNLVEILKDVPKGTRLWSPIYGECEFKKIDTTDKTFPICCIDTAVADEWRFKADGTFFEYGGECVLFPSKENRDWSTFNVPAHKHFEPFQKVLIRTWTEDEYIWVAAEYSNYDELHNNHYLVSGLIAKEEDVIPYKGNEDKLGKPANN